VCVCVCISMENLYSDLLSLCSQCDGFYFKDLVLDSIKYRVFSYHLCTYEQFHRYPSGLNCRGTMFDITSETNIRLVSLPPEKFFNYEEGNGLNIHPLGQFYLQMEKLDGSLISTYLHRIDENQQILRLKSKTSLTSDQATESMALLTDLYRDEIDRLVRLDYTVNFEYTSPTNIIVVRYSNAQLRVLSIRSHSTGKTLVGDELLSFLQENHFPMMIENLVSFKLFSQPTNQQQIVEDIKKEAEGEGYVVQIINPQNQSYFVKIKNEKYLLLHRTKFTLCSNEYIRQAVILQQTDNLRALFVDDPSILNTIRETEERIQPIYNQMVKSIETFHQENKHLSRKDFALKIIDTPDFKIFMPLLMCLYTGKDAEYEKFAVRNMDKLFYHEKNV